MLFDLIFKVLRCVNSVSYICGKVFLLEIFMFGFYRIKSVSYMLSGSFGFRYCFINGIIKNMMWNKKLVLCIISLFIKVFIEILW